jgi:hypothetical protein
MAQAQLHLAARDAVFVQPGHFPARTDHERQALPVRKLEILVGWLGFFAYE